jgi:hypothetical protein
MKKKKPIYEPLLDRLDITEKRHKGNAESREARQSLQGSLSAVRERVFNYVDQRLAWGSTSDEAVYALDMLHQTVSARFAELKALGRIVPSGERRKTRSGRNAAVFISSRVADGLEEEEARQREIDELDAMMSEEEKLGGMF